MPGETTANVSAWTIDSAMTYMQKQHDDLIKKLDERYATQTKAVDAAFASAKEAVLKAEGASDKRFEGVNEFRQTLTDLSATFSTRDAMDAFKDAVADRFREILARLDRMEGKSNGLHAGWGYLVGVVGLAAGAVGIILALNGQ